MSAGMAGIIRVHGVYGFSAGTHTACSCNRRWVLNSEYRAHVAEELAKAGYGLVQETLLAAADEMPIETLLGADKASVWLRQRAHSLDPAGHALVQAIHQRKTASNGN